MNIPLKRFFLFSIFLLPLTMSGEVTAKSEQAARQASDYDSRELAGWEVHLDHSLQNQDLEKKALALLEKNLTEIKTLFEKSPKIIAELQDVPIWITEGAALHGAAYHPSRDWLKNNQRVPEMARSIEIQSASDFINWAPTQPAMILHELAHSYHHRHFNFQQADITAAFKAAVASKKYEKVKHHNGKEQRHYALTNEKEYFAETTEAYFLKNDFTPFNKSALKKFDQKGYDMIEKVWQVQRK